MIIEHWIFNLSWWLIGVVNLLSNGYRFLIIVSAIQFIHTMEQPLQEKGFTEADILQQLAHDRRRLSFMWRFCSGSSPASDGWRSKCGIEKLKPKISTFPLWKFHYFDPSPTQFHYFSPSPKFSSSTLSHQPPLSLPLLCKIS
jgi:hypothetical protein